MNPAFFPPDRPFFHDFACEQQGRYSRTRGLRTDRSILADEEWTHGLGGLTDIWPGFASSFCVLVLHVIDTRALSVYGPLNRIDNQRSRRFLAGRTVIFNFSNTRKHKRCLGWS